MGKLKFNRLRRTVSSTEAVYDPCNSHQHYVALFNLCSTYLPFSQTCDLHRLDDVDHSTGDISQMNMTKSSNSSLLVPNFSDLMHSSPSLTKTLSSSSCHPQQKSSKMSFPSCLSSRQYVLVCFFLVITLFITSTLSFPNCPSSNQICRLIRKTCHDRSNSMSMPSFGVGGNGVVSDNATECECVTIHEGGWEITCNDPTATTEATNKEFDSEDYMPAFNLLQPLFFIRYEQARQVKITCETGTPNFKPALFQGKHLDIGGLYYQTCYYLSDNID